MNRKDEFLQKSKYFKWMIPTKDTELHERQNDFVWQESPGLYCSVPKEDFRGLTKEEMVAESEFWKKQRKDQEQFSIISVFHLGHMNTTIHREAAEQIIRDTFKAVAVINDSALGRMAMKMFLAIKPAQGYELRGCGQLR